jgi:hypothetical protein
VGGLKLAVLAPDLGGSLPVRVQIRIRHLPFQLAEAALDLFDQLIDHAPIVAHRPGPDTSLPRPHPRGRPGRHLHARLLRHRPELVTRDDGHDARSLGPGLHPVVCRRLGTRGLIVTGVALALIAASVIALGALTIAG